jgi:hypothetical protein
MEIHLFFQQHEQLYPEAHPVTHPRLCVTRMHPLERSNLTYNRDTYYVTCMVLVVVYKSIDKPLAHNFKTP